MKQKECFEWKAGFIGEMSRAGWKKALAKYRKEFGITEEKAKEWLAWYRNEVAVPEVYYETGETSVRVPGKKGTATDVTDMPLVVKGIGKAGFMGNVYPLEREGLYRFVEMGERLRNLIVIRNNTSVMPLIKALSMMQIHGNRDYKDYPAGVKAWKKLLLSRFWISLTCGSIAQLANEILADAGFKARLLSAMTVDEWNTYNNGHVISEVFFPDASKWVLTDVDMGCVFMDNGRLLSALEFQRNVRENRRPEFVALAPKETDPLWMESSGFSYAHMWRRTVAGLEAKWNWYRRIFHAFGFEDKKRGKVIYLASGRTAQRVLGYRGHYSEVMDEPEFVKKFYGSEK